MDLKARLGRELLFFDGAMGTMLQAAGLGPGELPELWNLERPSLVREIHTAYLQAGAQLLKSNTFGANRLKLDRVGRTVEEVVSRGVSLAREAAARAGRGLVGLDIGPTGRLLQPLGDLAFEEAVSVFAQMVRAGAAAGADFVLIETMTDLYEAKAAVLAARENCALPVFVTMTFDSSGKLLTGGDLSGMAAVLEGLGVDAMGLNCGLGPKQMQDLTASLRSLTSLPLIVNPNAGLPRQENGRTVYDVDPEEFAEDLERIVLSGACAVGGCCGTTPAHLAALTGRLSGLVPAPAPTVRRTVISSGSRAVEFGGAPILIGERINPTGKRRFQQALREHDLPYLLAEGVAQEDAGAHVLDVNVGLPEIDEPVLMCETVQELQAVTPLPLQIDSSDPVTLERAMRLYNGKPLVNSVTAKQESMAAVFPLVKKYGGVVIGLTITEEGIPETAQGRLQAARRIVETAEHYGIARQDIVIDPLTMAISAGQNAARVTLEALRMIRKELGVYTSLGVSNVSFGLPQRENITAAFFLMALHSGLDAAILNPRSEAMMRAYRSYCALAALDENCMDYVNAYAQQTQPTAPAGSGQQVLSLGEAVEKGLKDAAYTAADALLQSGAEGMELINGHIVPALDAVGRRFEEKTLFLPQLLMSAEAAKAAFSAVRKRMRGSGPAENALTVVIATVKGDVHDIGKNIVRTLLENYGFRVFDLGKDVPPETVLTAVREHRAQLVGLSALMTTTVIHMQETIALLRRKEPQVKIMVGGAVLTQEYADSIGADFYGKDAMASVRYATALAQQLGLR